MEELDSAWQQRVEAHGECIGPPLSRAGDPDENRRGCTFGPDDQPIRGNQGSDNQLVFTTARYRSNPLVITGPGAGAEVTAAGVLNDILRLAGA